MRRLGALTGATIVGATVLAATACADQAPTARVHHANPFRNGPVHLEPDPSASAAVLGATGADKRILTRFAKVPSAVWLTPEAYPIGRVGERTAAVVRRAASRHQTPLFVVYGIPHRDCTAGASAGGLDAQRYRTWVREIAAATDRWTAVVLEPDALPAAAQCHINGLVGSRERLLSRAVRTFAARGTAVYLDAGHARWRSPTVMATLLRRAGLAHARGFSLNVSSFDATASEKAYGRRLRALTGGHAHFVIDTGRNGNGASDQWCNPPGRALGATPHAVGRNGLDALLRVHRRGEVQGHPLSTDRHRVDPLVAQLEGALRGRDQHAVLVGERLRVEGDLLGHRVEVIGRLRGVSRTLRRRRHADVAEPHLALGAERVAQAAVEVVDREREREHLGAPGVPEVRTRGRLVGEHREHVVEVVHVDVRLERAVTGELRGEDLLRVAQGGCLVGGVVRGAGQRTPSEGEEHQETCAEGDQGPAGAWDGEHRDHTLNPW